MKIYEREALRFLSLSLDLSFFFMFFFFYATMLIFDPVIT